MDGSLGQNQMPLLYYIKHGGGEQIDLTDLISYIFIAIYGENRALHWMSVTEILVDLVNRVLNEQE